MTRLNIMSAAITSCTVGPTILTMQNIYMVYVQDRVERHDSSTDFPKKRKHQNVYKIGFAQVPQSVPQITFNPNSTPYIRSIELSLFAHGVWKQNNWGRLDFAVLFTLFTSNRQN